MSDILSTGSSALMAFQRALSTVGNNIANVNTPGYSRQRVDLTNRPGQYYGFGFLGNGVQVTNVERIVDNILTGRSLQSAGELGRLTQLSTLASNVATTFSDSATSIAQPMSNFFDGAQAVSSDPTSTAARNQLLGNAKDLVNRFKSLQSQLNQLDNEADQRLAQGVNDVNNITSQIAKLNEEISRQTGASNGGAPNDLLDQRDQLIQTLSGKIGVTTLKQDDGSLNVFTTSGQVLVVGNQTSKLTTVADPYQPTRHSLAIAGTGGSVAIPDGSVGGELGGVLNFRHDVIDPTAAQLGQLAAGLAAKINTQQHSGVDLNGNIGADFFTMPTPQVYGRSTNTGSATLSASISDVTQLTTSDFTMKFDGTNWSATDSKTGATLPMSGAGTSASPFVVNGVSVTVGGAAASGDSFLVRPTAQAAGQLGVVITDPNKIAAALPVRGTAAATNSGNASFGNFSVTDPTNPNLQSAVTIQFTGPNTYSINGSGSYSYTAGTPISINGWQTTLNGTPSTGDTFTVGATGPGSSDNGNMRAFAADGDAGLFNNGGTSLTQGVSQLTSSVGSIASQAQYAQGAQSAIDTQLTSQRNSVSGVNLDEEASDMVRFQQAYQAAAQIIQVANETFQSILSAVHG
jgi:flagellar hook-associated protein 1 FlgK